MRTQLRRAIEAAFTFPEYTSYCGFIANINAAELRLPCVWMNPLELTGKTGREEGEMTYAVSLYMMTRQDAWTEERKEKAWTEMEKQTTEALQRLNEGEVMITVNNLKCAPDEYSLTSFGEVSLHVTFIASIKYPC